MEPPQIPTGYHIDDQSDEENELFLGNSDDLTWTGPPRDAYDDAVRDCIEHVRILLLQEIYHADIFETAIQIYVDGLRQAQRNPVRRAHRLAMAAKHLIFRAQDEAGLIEVVGGQSIRGWLAKLRAKLEGFDRSTRQLRAFKDEQGEAR